MLELHENEFLTIEASSEGFFKDSGSKFLGFAFPFEDEAELKKIIDNVKKEHHNARHFCFAYRLHPEQEIERANDDGEPNHSAGTPILGQLHAHQLINILVVVVRYFGGSKLGIPGLIHAYKSAAADAIIHSKIIKKEIESSISVEFEYADLNDVMRVVKKEDVRLINQTQHLTVKMTLSTRKDKLQEVKAQLELLKSLTFVT